MTNLKTSEQLLNRISIAASKSLNAEEVRRQKISFILGSLKTDSVTRAQVSDVLAKNDGEKTAA